jgi:hypothetical protein
MARSGDFSSEVSQRSLIDHHAARGGLVVRMFGESHGTFVEPLGVAEVTTFEGEAAEDVQGGSFDLASTRISTQAERGFGCFTCVGQFSSARRTACDDE